MLQDGFPGKQTQMEIGVPEKMSWDMFLKGMKQTFMNNNNDFNNLGEYIENIINVRRDNKLFEQSHLLILLKW